jgi:integrase
MHRPTVDSVLATSREAYSIRTIQGYSADLRIFADWCNQRKARWMPASPHTVADFVDCQVTKYRISTIKRRLCAIAFAHRMRDLPTPTEANVVQLAIRRASRKRASRPQQKLGLTDRIRAEIVAACPKTLDGVRDAAIISAGYDTLCRSSELAAIELQHLNLHPDGSGSLLIPRAKSDVDGEGRIAHLSPETAKLVSQWIEGAELEIGPLFRSLHLHRVADGPMCTSSIRRLIKRATIRAGLDPAVAADLSGHSMRIGAAQDMMLAGFDSLAIMQAGGWKSANVVLRYVENAATREIHQMRWNRLRATKP